MPYNIDHHQHRFAAWAASRAASVKGGRFAVSAGACWLESVGLDAAFKFDQLPTTAEVFDGWHRDMRGKLVEKSNKVLRHGQAAKLINCYVKARFINGFSSEKPAAHVAHPPIDELLLIAIVDAKLLQQEAERAAKRLRNARWSKWSSEQYEEAIAILRTINPNHPFWMIEEHWVGYQ